MASYSEVAGSSSVVVYLMQFNGERQDWILYSWIKRDQLDVTCFFFHYLMLNMFRMFIHPSSGACDIKLVSLYSAIKKMHGPINIRWILYVFRTLRVLTAIYHPIYALCGIPLMKYINFYMFGHRDAILRELLDQKYIC